MAPDLCGHILAFCAEGEELDEVEVVGQVPHVVSLLHTHELQQCAEGLVVVEQEDVVPSIGQLVKGEEGVGVVRGKMRDKMRKEGGKGKFREIGSDQESTNYCMCIYMQALYIAWVCLHTHMHFIRLCI